MKKLNLGAGTDIRKGYVNLDIVKLKGIDVVHLFGLLLRNGQEVERRKRVALCLVTWVP